MSPTDGLALLTKVAADAGFETISLADCFAGHAMPRCSSESGTIIPTLSATG